MKAEIIPVLKEEDTLSSIIKEHEKIKPGNMFLLNEEALNDLLKSAHCKSYLFLRRDADENPEICELSTFEGFDWKSLQCEIHLEWTKTAKNPTAVLYIRSYGRFYTIEGIISGKIRYDKKNVINGLYYFKKENN